MAGRALPLRLARVGQGDGDAAAVLVEKVHRIYRELLVQVCGNAKGCGLVAANGQHIAIARRAKARKIDQVHRVTRLFVSPQRFGLAAGDCLAALQELPGQGFGGGAYIASELAALRKVAHLVEPDGRCGHHHRRRWGGELGVGDEHVVNANRDGFGRASQGATHVQCQFG